MEAALTKRQNDSKTIYLNLKLSEFYPLVLSHFIYRPRTNHVLGTELVLPALNSTYYQIPVSFLPQQWLADLVVLADGTDRALTPLVVRDPDHAVCHIFSAKHPSLTVPAEMTAHTVLARQPMADSRFADLLVGARYMGLDLEYPVVCG